MEEYKIKRINELAKKSKSVGLSDDEKKEQKQLRDEYRAAVVSSLQGSLDNTYIKTPDGKKRKLNKK